MTDRDARQLPGPLDRLADETGSVIGPRPDPAPASGKRFGRDLHARRRDEAALRRDVNASDRDRRAHTRDTELAQLQAAYVAARQPADEALLLLLEASRRLRDDAATDRARAADDRLHAANDRLEAAADRRRARMEVERAQLDGLTGVWLRDLGLVRLQQELERAQRSGEPFVLAFVDVDGLKAINDRDGHAAGDALLRAVVQALRTKLRSYDPIVRIGGDEFLCGVVNSPLDAAYRRFAEIQLAVGIGWPAGSISVGLAEIEPRDTLERLTARADQAMYEQKAARS